MSEEYALDQVAIRMVKLPPLMSKEPMNNPDAAVRLMNETLKEFDREAVVVVNLQNDLKPINMNFVSMGTLNASAVHPREILKASILSNAASIMLFHNHPSGRLEPSSEDIALTDQLQQACTTIGIPIIDHIIIGTDDRYYSFHEKKILPVSELKVVQDIDSFRWEESRVAEKPTASDRKPSVRRRLQKETQGDPAAPDKPGKTKPITRKSTRKKEAIDR